MLRERVGVYVDQSNINMSGGYAMDYAVLRNFALRGGAQGVHLNVYSAFDAAKADKDPSWASRFLGYQSKVRELGYHMKMKQSQVYDDGEKLTSKANADIDIAVDIMESASRLDRVVLVTGDGDFSPLIHAARRLGSRVEVIAFDNCSALLREAADAVFSGWLVPGLLPPQGEGNRIRGIVETISIQGSELGVIRFMLDDFINAQPLMPMAPESCGYALFHHDSVPAQQLNILRGSIVEFTPHLAEADTEQEQADIRAMDIVPIRICTKSGWYQPFRVE